MKNFFIMAACLVAMATTANAQFMGGSSSNNNSFDNDGYTGIRLHYNNFEIEPDESEISLDAIPSFGVTFVKGWAVSNSIPIFLETGIGVSYATGDLKNEIEDEEDYYFSTKITAKLLSGEIPVSLGYKFNFNEEFSIMPFVGITTRFIVNSEIERKEDYDFSYNYGSETTEVDVKKFQLGWQIGARIIRDKFNLGVSYGTDLNEIVDEGKAKSLAISVGYNF